MNNLDKYTTPPPLFQIILKKPARARQPFRLSASLPPGRNRPFLRSF